MPLPATGPQTAPVADAAEDQAAENVVVLGAVRPVRAVLAAPGDQEILCLGEGGVVDDRRVDDLVPGFMISQTTVLTVSQLSAGWLVVTVRGRSWRAGSSRERRRSWRRRRPSEVMATPRQPREARSRTAQTKAGTASILAKPGGYAVPASWVQSLRMF